MSLTAAWSRRQCGHHVAQNSTRTTRPRRDVLLNVWPSSDWVENSGARAPVSALATAQKTVKLSKPQRIRLRLARFTIHLFGTENWRAAIKDDSVCHRSEERRVGKECRSRW